MPFRMLFRIQQLIEIGSGDLRHLSAVHQICFHRGADALTFFLVGKQTRGKDHIQRRSADALLQRQLCDGTEQRRHTADVIAGTRTDGIAERLAPVTAVRERTHPMTVMDPALQQRTGARIDAAAQPVLLFPGISIS